MRFVDGMLLFFLLVWSPYLRAQEIKYLDLSLSNSARSFAILQHQSRTVRKAVAASAVVGVAEVSSMVHLMCATHMRWAPTCWVSLRQTSIRMYRSRPSSRFLIPGSAPIEVPISPDLSNLQPRDESVAFSYLSLGLLVRGEGEPKGPKVSTIGFVELYGSTDQDGSVLVLKPGEWIRVRANVKLQTPPTEPASAHFRGDFWLRRNIFRPFPGGAFTETTNLYPNATPTPSIAVRLLGPRRSEQPKQ